MHFAQQRNAFEGGEMHQDIGVVGAHRGNLAPAKCFGC